MSSPNTLLTPEKAIAALKETVAALSQPEEPLKITEAKNNASNDMLKFMQIVLPLCMQIQQDIIKNYGFSADIEGLLKFTKTVKQLEKDNPEISQLNDELGALLITPMSHSYPHLPSN